MATSKLDNLRHYPTFQALFFFALAMFMVNLLMDHIHAMRFHYHFYWSEALMFAGKWFLFVPGYFLLRWLDRTFILPRSLGSTLWRIPIYSCILAFFHTLLLALIILGLSHLLHASPFTFLSLLTDLISDNFLFMAAIYGVLPFLPFPASSDPAGLNRDRDYLSVLSIEGDGKTDLVDVLEICSISTVKGISIVSTIYGRQLVCHSSLKALEQALHPKHFCRIHRQTLVRIDQVSGWSSRGNGDYDLSMSNGMTCRLSRRFRHLLKARSNP